MNQNETLAASFKLSSGVISLAQSSTATSTCPIDFKRGESKLCYVEQSDNDNDDFCSYATSGFGLCNQHESNRDDCACGGDIHELDRLEYCGGRADDGYECRVPYNGCAARADSIGI